SLTACAFKVVLAKSFFARTHTQILHDKGCLIIHSQPTFNLSTSKHHCPSIIFRPLRSEDAQPLQMARTRQAKAAASETESASQSPKTTRRSKADAFETVSVDFNNEDYNISSPKRTRLLT